MGVALTQHRNDLVGEGGKSELKLHCTDLTFFLVENIEDVFIEELKSLDRSFHINRRNGVLKEATARVEECFDRMKSCLILVNKDKYFSI